MQQVGRKTIPIECQQSVYAGANHGDEIVSEAERGRSRRHKQVPFRHYHQKTRGIK